MRELVREALFLRDHPDPPSRSFAAEPGTTVHLLLRGRPANVAFWKAVLAEIRRDDLGGPRVRVYRNATRLGVVPYVLPRTRPGLRLLGNLWDVPAPPYFDAHVIPHFDGMIELCYQKSADPAALDLADRVRTVCAELSTFECDRRYTIVPSSGTTQRSVFLTVLSRTPWNRTRAEAQRYWIGKHAPLVFDNADHTNMCGYEQVHTTLGGSSFDNAYEGVAYIEFRRLADFLSQSVRLDTLRFNNTLIVDEMNMTINSEIHLFRRYDLS